MAYLYFFLTALAIFGLTAFLYINAVVGVSKLFPNFDAGKIIFAVPLLICGPLFFLIKFLTKNQQDILFCPSDFLLCEVLAGAFIIGVCGLSEKMNKFSLLALAVCCGICGCFLPDGFVLYELELAPIYQKMSVAVSWFLIAVSCAVLAITAGLLSVFTIILSLVIMAFYIISATSTMQLLFAAVMLGIALGYMLFNWRPAQMKMNFAAVLSFGFILGFIVLGNSAEGMWLPLQIIILYLYIVLFSYLLQKISFIDPDDESEDKIVSCIKLMPILIVIAFMQVYAETSKTLPIVAFMAILWAKSKIGFNGKKKSFKEINQETIENIKDGINEIRKFLDKK